MRTLIAMALALLGVSAWSQPFQRQFFTTNPAPVVQVVAGTNVFITYTTPGTQTRTFRIDVPASGTATNVFTSSTTNGSYIFITTNGLNYEFALDRSITNGLVNSSVTNGLATTNWVGSNFQLQSTAATTNGFVTSNITNGLATTNWVGANYQTIAGAATTNGFVGSSVTNGLATTNWVGANFALQSSIPTTNGFVTSSVTNGLATTNWVGANYQTIALAATTNGFVDASVTNGLATTNWVGANYQTLALAATTNGLVGASVTNGLLGSGTAAATYLSLAGGTETGPVLSTSSTTNAPSATELATAGWVRSLFGGGFLYYATTNIDTAATNPATAGQPVYQFGGVIPASSSRSYTNPSAGTYAGSVMTTNTFTFLNSPVSVNAYMSLTSGGGDAMTVNPELYYSYDKTNWFGDFDCQAQNIVGGATNLYQYVISFPALTATNSTGFYLERRMKVRTKAGSPTLTFLVGTNTVSGTNNASHITLVGPNSAAGNAYLANNQTFTGNNTFLNTSYSTNLSTMAPDFNKTYSTITTNAAFAFLAPLNVSASVAQTSVIWVTNSTAAAVAVTAPANVHTQGTWFITNATVFTFFNYPPFLTNAIAFPLW